MLRLTCRTPSIVLHYPEDICALSWTLEEIPAAMVAWVYHANTPRQWRTLAWFGLTPDFTRDGQPYRNPEDGRVQKLMADGKQARLYNWWHTEQVKNVSAEKADHPCQIPLSVMRRALKVTPITGKVIDPYMGTGTTLVAAKDLGLPATGIETSEAYCEIAAKRLSQEVLFA